MALITTAAAAALRVKATCSIAQKRFLAQRPELPLVKCTRAQASALLRRRLVRRPRRHRITRYARAASSDSQHSALPELEGAVHRAVEVAWSQVTTRRIVS